MDEIRVTDSTGVKYVFRGVEIYRIVNGKEVLVPQSEREKHGRKEDPSDRSRK